MRISDLSSDVCSSDLRRQHVPPRPSREQRVLSALTGGSTSSPRRVLIVDYDPAILRMIERVLETEGFEVTAVADAQLALDLLDREFAAVVISVERGAGEE